MLTRKIYDYFDKIIPSALSCEWDNDGLMLLPDNNHKTKKILLTLDITSRIVKYARENDFDLIISHHPLIFKPMRALNPYSPCGDKSLELLKSGIAAMSFHTRLDAAFGGVNDVLCRLLGLENAVAVEREGEGMVRFCTLEAEMDFNELLNKTKKALSAPFMTYVKNTDRVKKIAVLGGDGKDFWQLAQKLGADVYITGNMSYNTMLDANDAKMSVIEAGHFYTEAPVLSFLYEKLTELSHEFEIEINMLGCEVECIK